MLIVNDNLNLIAKVLTVLVTNNKTSFYKTRLFIVNIFSQTLQQDILCMYKISLIIVAAAGTNVHLSSGNHRNSQVFIPLAS